MNCKLASIALVAFILAGCGNDDKGDSTDAGTGSPPTDSGNPPTDSGNPPTDSESPPEAFNFTTIEVDKSSGNGTFAATFKWDVAPNATSYTLCLENTEKENNCDPLEDVSNNSVTTVIGGPLKNLSSNFFVLAKNDKYTTPSNVKSLTPEQLSELIAHVKSSNSEAGDNFGVSVALSSDGKTLAVGATGEDSGSQGIGTNPNDISADSGAVYIYRYDGANWEEQEYIKAQNSGIGYYFGTGVALSSDGNTLVVGSNREDSNTTGINSTTEDDPAADPAAESGAVYIY